MHASDCPALVLFAVPRAAAHPETVALEQTVAASPLLVLLLVRLVLKGSILWCRISLLPCIPDQFCRNSLGLHHIHLV